MITPSDIRLMEELTDALNRNTGATRQLEKEVRALITVLDELLAALKAARKPWWKR